MVLCKEVATTCKFLTLACTVAGATSAFCVLCRLKAMQERHGVTLQGVVPPVVPVIPPVVG